MEGQLPLATHNDITKKLDTVGFSTETGKAIHDRFKEQVPYFLEVNSIIQGVLKSYGYRSDWLGGNLFTGRSEDSLLVSMYLQVGHTLVTSSYKLSKNGDWKSVYEVHKGERIVRHIDDPEIEFLPLYIPEDRELFNTLKNGIH